MSFILVLFLLSMDFVEKCVLFNNNRKPLDIEKDDAASYDGVIQRAKGADCLQAFGGCREGIWFNERNEFPALWGGNSERQSEGRERTR